jgi:aryl-alcohol dehydrogenase-like predicted oxidoreductase
LRYRKLPSTDIEVSVVCMGCWALVESGFWGPQDEAESVAAVHAALDAGVNFFDTAEGYGRGASERVLGRALGSRRADATIATKVGRRSLKRDDLFEHLETSLANLGTDYVDLYQIHWPSPDIPIEETLAAMYEARDQGKIRAVGVSNFGASYLGELVAAGAVSTNQLCYSLLWRAIEHEVLPICLDNGIGVLCYSPLAQGLLTGKFASPEEVPAGRARTRLFRPERGGNEHRDPGCEEETFAALADIRPICEAAGFTMTEASLAWALAQPGVVSVIAGARHADQATENAKVCDVELPAEVIEKLTAATEPVRSCVGLNADFWMSDSRMERPA